MGTEFQTTLGGGRLQDVIAQGELENEPRTYVTKSGEVIEVELSATADRDSTGAVVALMVASKDVTERNRQERQLRAAFEENARLRAELERERDYLREEVQRVDELRPHHRREPGAAEDARAHRGGRADVGERADPRRVGRRQGARRARDPRAQPAQRRPARQSQLRVDSA